jgi:hypothetical protein
MTLVTTGLLARYPSFAGRAKKSANAFHSFSDHAASLLNVASPIWSDDQVVVPSGGSGPNAGGGVPLLEIQVEGTVAAAMVDPTHRNARGFANIPDLEEAVGKGRNFSNETPLFTVTLVHFADGGSALAIAVSHGLVDGKGFAELMKMWSFGTVLVFRQDFALEDAIGSHACSLETNMRMTNGIPLGSPLLLPVSS